MLLHIQVIADGDESTLLPMRAKVKIINPNNSGGNIVRDWNIEKTFDTVTVLKSELGQVFAEFIVDEYDVGYIMLPGHGMKGKHLNLSNDSDIATMYTEFKKKKCILLWIKCLAKSRKRSSESPDTCPNWKRSGSIYDSTIQKIHEVDVIVKQLKSKHEGKYTAEQIRCWANMIQIKQHESYEVAPNKPFFKTKTKAADSTNAGVSPGKKVTLRSQCIQQLDKWHDLLVQGVITDEQYQEFKATILADLKKF